MIKQYSVYQELSFVVFIFIDNTFVLKIFDLMFYNCLPLIVEDEYHLKLEIIYCNFDFENNRFQFCLLTVCANDYYFLFI